MSKFISSINYMNISEANKNYFDQLPDKVYSVTELEDYAKCPYMYYAKRILRFGDEDEEETTLKPLEKGNLLHTVLYKFYTTLKLEQTTAIIKGNKGDNTYPTLTGVDLKAGNRQKYLDLLHNITREELETIKYDSAFFVIDELQLLGTGNNRGLLGKWLDNELAKIKEGWKYAPALFELSFGGQKDAIGAVELSEKLSLKGKIDRIEVLEVGDGTLEVVIADYKLTNSTSLATNKRVEAGLSFQMPLYMLAVEQILKQYYGKEVNLAGAVYYILNTKYDNTYYKTILTHKNTALPPEATKRGAYKAYGELEDALDVSLKHAEEIITNISAGNFPVKPVNKAVCEYCNFKPVCRIAEKAY